MWLPVNKRGTLMEQFETNAQALLELLHLRGIEYFLANPGTDFASIGREWGTGINI
jgi:hypothetical protein